MHRDERRRRGVSLPGSLRAQAHSGDGRPGGKSWVQEATRDGYPLRRRLRRRLCVPAREARRSIRRTLPLRIQRPDQGGRTGPREALSSRRAYDPLGADGPQKRWEQESTGPTVRTRNRPRRPVSLAVPYEEQDYDRIVAWEPRPLDGLVERQVLPLGC